MSESEDQSRRKIVPFIWYDSEAEGAARLYTSLFPGGRITQVSHYRGEGEHIHGQPAGKVMTVGFELDGQAFCGINGGPVFRPNPSISFFVHLDSHDKVDALWAGLVDGGQVLMALDAYPWSTRYGWLSDRYGVSWQIAAWDRAAERQSIIPSLMFTGDRDGRAAEAIDLYTSVFPNSARGAVRYRQTGDGQPRDSVLHGRFTLFGQSFSIMDGDGPHDFTFNEGVSLMVSCEDQAELDGYWAALTADGGSDMRCGWVRDRFGVFWQLVPTALPRLMTSPDRALASRVTQAMLTMNRIDIATLEAAARGE
ncbi:putative 3-demethylubiquinone-9 3-methyltransferase (glyoxalase superfamily) [Hoeflea marina]|uniref:Putative 3-demethylubiquinone-9 3-methyltransferase (Glyoxalase superfamily) n=1 Tax=Hoeflea marina TaxID=274592 RepID=A0A317PVB0_9HYPH|nr:VOC family protein [Hoeflea marina]PWW03360.1 putative 3-demethylubiquinone-9 3-methyltransferase (glyoxalase superfamily) [Hoeflea marina]